MVDSRSLDMTIVQSICAQRNCDLEMESGNSACHITPLVTSYLLYPDSCCNSIIMGEFDLTLEARNQFMHHAGGRNAAKQYVQRSRLKMMKSHVVE